MKKITTLFLTLFVAVSANSQVLLSEDFTNGIPSSFTLYDEDGRSVSSNIASFFPNAWNQLVFQGTTDFFAASTSSYSPAGQSDDWLVTPSLSLTNNNYLIWEGRSANANNLESYEVLISETGKVVADFTTVLLSVQNETVEWNKRSVDLSAYAGSTVYIAFRNRSNSKFVLGIDDIEVRPVELIDASITELAIEDTYKENDPVSVEGIIANNGLNTISSVDVSYSVNGAATVTQTLTGLTIDPFTSYNFSLNTTFTATNVGNFSDVKVWVSNPNGGVDLDNGNNLLSKEIFVITGKTVNRNVLVEEFATAPCQFCPDAVPAIEDIVAADPNAIPVTHHAGFSTDGMTIAEHSTYASDFVTGAPSAAIDRILFDGDATVGTSSRSLWRTRAASRKLVGSPVAVSMTGFYDVTANSLDLRVDADFVDYMKPDSDLRLTIFVVEDSVTNNPTAGYDRDWDQVNAYYASQGHPYFGVGTQFNASTSFINNYVHRFVVRDVYPSNDAYGDAGVIASITAPYSNFSKRITIPINRSWDEGQVTIVAFVNYDDIDESKRPIVNAKQIRLLNIPSELDAALTSLDVPNVVLSGDSIDVNGLIENAGTDTINSLDINWSIDGGITSTESYDSLSLAFDDNFAYALSSKIEISGIVNSAKNLRVWVSNVNGITDDESINDTISTDIEIKLALDGELSVLNLASEVGENLDLDIGGIIRNNGINAITSVDVSWSVDGGIATTETFNGLNIASDETYSFSHGTPWTAIDLNTTKSFEVWISNTNGMGEVETSNDTLSEDVNVIAALDIELILLAVNDTLFVNQPTNIRGVIKNLGGEAITSFEVNWNVDGGSVSTDTISNISVQTNDFYFFTHDTQYIPQTVNAGGLLTVWVSKVNNSAVPINSNDTLTQQFLVITGLNESSKFVSDLNIFPNPTSNLTNVKLNLTRNKNVEVRVYDIVGKEMIFENFGNLSKGSQIIKLDVSNLSNGVYFVSLKIDGDIISSKIIVSK